ncbi:MAG: zinc-ribbon and DUF3426 domain-containing protein, partial [Porticoccus sp.]
MTEIITRCPGCSVSFRASLAHLEAANGQVKCGSCLLIFDACAHQIEEEQPSDNPYENNLSLDSDDFLIYDDMDISVLDGYEQDGPLQQDLLTTTEQSSAQPPGIDSHINPETETETGLFGSGEITTTPDFLIAPESSPRDYLKMLLWPTLSVLAMMALIFQYIYFHADLLGTAPTYRPWLMRFCDITTCKLPIMKDTTKIRSSKLLVHSHPTISDALIVDAVIINEANFDQPFPELALNFEDLQGASVAHRNFKPDEYLHGEMTGVSIMPAGRPVRLTLE